MTLYHVHMQLARTPDFPEGSKDHGYDLILPLTSEQRFDARAWKAQSGGGKVRRFWGSEEPRNGLLRHAGHQWFVDYDMKVEGDEEPFFKLENHKIMQGEYLSLNDADGETHTFLITSVTALPEKAG